MTGNDQDKLAKAKCEVHEMKKQLEQTAELLEEALTRTIWLLRGDRNKHPLLTTGRRHTRFSLPTE